MHVCQRCDVPIFERDGAVAVFAPSSRFLLIRPSSAVAVLARSSDVPFIRSANDVMTLVPSSDVAVPDRQFDPVQLGDAATGVDPGPIGLHAEKCHLVGLGCGA